MKKTKKVSLCVLRKSKGLSQRDLAAQIMLSPSTIAQYELGGRKPTLKNALLIAQFFNIPVDRISFETMK